MRIPISQIESKLNASEALLAFVEKATQLDSLEDTLWHVAHHIIQSFGFEDCVIYLLEDDGKTLTQTAAYGPKNPERNEILNPIKLTVGQGVVGNAALNRVTVKIDDTTLCPDYIVDDEPRLSELVVPIIFQGELLGMIDSEHSQKNFFTNSHQKHLEILASLLASKIRVNISLSALKKSYNELEKAKNLSDTYLEISKLTYESISMEDFYLHLHQLIQRQVDTHSFYVVLFDTESNQYSCPYIHDELNGGQFDYQLEQEVYHRSLIAEVINEQKPRLVEHEELIERAKSGKLLHRGSIAFSWIGVPFEISGGLHGAIALQSYDNRVHFNIDDKEFLTFIGQHISTAIDQKLKDQRLTYQALHDPVTELGNRSMFLDRIEHAFVRTLRTRTADLAVLFIDFDDFKLINDNYGHQAGDQVLRETAFRMSALLREADSIARLGGDEFAILLEDLEGQSFALTVARRILKAMKEPVLIDEKPLYISISIGIALKSAETRTAEDLLKNADHAMYHAKENGKNNIQIYESQLHQSVVHARQLLQELKVAIKENQLMFYYQPIIDLENERVSGFEALMRWQHPTKGVISPATFIKIAEQNDLIKKMDSQLLNTVASQLSEWQNISTLPIYVSINISTQRFTDGQLIREIAETIEQFKLAPSSIIVEVTEHTLMENIGKARHLFHQLKEIGVKISLDDFGTGYSSLSYLNQLPFDIVKIDRSFVTQISKSKKEHPIINTIVALAQTLKMSLVAEGIESLQQMETLRALGCKFGQGFYLSKPLPPHKAREFLEKFNGR